MKSLKTRSFRAAGTRGILAAVTALTISAGLSLATAAPAQATAHGVSWWGSACWPNIPCVYKGNIAFSVFGSGLKVDHLRTTWSAYGPVYNWRIDYEFFDTSNRSYQTLFGPTRNGRYTAGSRDLNNLHFKADRGRVCSRIYSNGIRLTSVCHSIY